MQEQFTVRKTVEIAIATEELGAKLYWRLAKQFAHDPELASLFDQLALEEQDHGLQFESLLDLVPADDEELDEETASRLRNLAASQYFLTKEGPFVGIDQVATERQALSHALTFEQATLELFLALRQILGRSVALDALVNTERAHVARLQDVLAELRPPPVEPDGQVEQHVQRA